MTHGHLDALIIKHSST